MISKKDSLVLFYSVLLLLSVFVFGIFWGAKNPEQPQEITQEFYPVEYQIIPYNVAGFEGQFDYVIQISTRDKSEVERIIKRLHGGSNEY